MLRRERLTDEGQGVIVNFYSKFNRSCIIYDSKFEIISFKIKTPNDCLIGFIAFYRSPNTNLDDFLRRI